MGVAAHTQDVYLPPDLVHHVQVLDTVLVDDLHGHLLVRHHVLCHCFSPVFFPRVLFCFVFLIYRGFFFDFPFSVLCFPRVLFSLFSLLMIHQAVFFCRDGYIGYMEGWGVRGRGMVVSQGWITSVRHRIS